MYECEATMFKGRGLDITFREDFMSKRFEGKVVVITGGNSGIGLATAKMFHDEGAKVAISGRDQKTLDEAVKTIGGGQVRQIRRSLR
jgi:NAD(P)-dependent dehydrogenase (short-subunit alcohol dehydrogenase family)